MNKEQEDNLSVSMEEMAHNQYPKVVTVLRDVLVGEVSGDVLEDALGTMLPERWYQLQLGQRWLLWLKSLLLCRVSHFICGKICDPRPLREEVKCWH